MEPTTLNVVDLFAGCGGLSLGFNLDEAPIRFRHVLAIDNEPSAVDLYNLNFKGYGGGDICRVADVTWFANVDEVRLYYLAHYAENYSDQHLADFLTEIGYKSFLSTLRQIDLSAQERFDELANSPLYSQAVSEVPNAALNIAVSKALFNKLAIKNIRKLSIDFDSLIWTQEYRSTEPAETYTPSHLAEMRSASQDKFRAIHGFISEASGKEGRGINKNNQGYLVSIRDTLFSSNGQRFQSIWEDWRTHRDAVRASFCLNNSARLAEKCADPAYRAHMILGGPPCKGFSRIGRPVIESLRDQGVHAWSHETYGDERNALMLQYVLFLEALQPDMFLFENVSNFQSVLKTPNGEFSAPDVLMELIDSLSSGSLSYNVKSSVLNARNFGVPQDRQRYIMFGVNAAVAPMEASKRFFSFEILKDVPLIHALYGLEPPHVFRFGSGDGTSTSSTSRSFLEPSPNMPDHVKRYVSWIVGGRKYGGEVDGHVVREGRPDDLAAIAFVAPGLRWMDLKTNDTKTIRQIRDALRKTSSKEVIDIVDESLTLRLLLEHATSKAGLPDNHLLDDCYLSKGSGRHGDWFERLSADSVCKTIVAHIGKDTYGYWHPFENRALSIREAARVQSFPDCFKFSGCGIVDTYTAIGNAVPPLMANAFAKKVSELYASFRMWERESEQVCKRHPIRHQQLSMI